MRTEDDVDEGREEGTKTGVQRQLGKGKREGNPGNGPLFPLGSLAYLQERGQARQGGGSNVGEDQ